MGTAMLRIPDAAHAWATVLAQREPRCHQLDAVKAHVAREAEGSLEVGVTGGLRPTDAERRKPTERLPSR